MKVNYQAEVEKSIVNYFNDLGKQVVEAIREKVMGNPRYKDDLPIVLGSIKNMVEAGALVVTGSFNCGEEGDIYRKLTGRDNGSYSRYFQTIYQELKNLLDRE